VHRIGRTGRAGNEGEAISLVSSDEMAYLKDIEKLLKKELPRKVVPGYEPTENFNKPAVKKPVFNRGGSGRNGFSEKRSFGDKRNSGDRERKGPPAKKTWGKKNPVRSR